MKIQRDKFSNYIRWQFEFYHMEYEIDLIVKLHLTSRRMYYSASWKTKRMRNAQFYIKSKEIPTMAIPPTGNYFLKPLRKDLFRKLRNSLSYGLNIKARAVMDKMMEANEQKKEFYCTRISGKA